ncbi:iron-containing alcohol dehydrogenase [Conexibacter stalactiti]|uniref:Iron-containing alcohol dehydrogenase n=1 Tax=Conexibacter stalactiti TaxID=1940611 RepID=A0ABU4HL31_9ACTN|nr:iron-containing alcohol dehydrogenase [Conexibacter stalactiti]MDW5594031.1 iron-containing alcohol dehydrogenase [Conexibacter stalactiti]MEC5034673.1 iron-containing alcohol dehydrogenase [Conexibacter stalactiti]
MAAAPFRHVEAERTLLFGRGALAEAAGLLGDGYTLLTTPRAAEAAPLVRAGAARVIEVPSGKVDEVAGDLLVGGVALGPPGTLLVALGGGRVIDVAKALAAAAGAGLAGGSPGAGSSEVGVGTPSPHAVAAIPTTLSGAEMTRGHRHARGVPAETPRVRPSIVLNDPALSASHELSELAASSANALGHVLIALTSSRTTPFAAAVAAEAARQFARAWEPLATASGGASGVGGAAPSGGAGAVGTADLPDPARDEVALGALLAGWAVDHSGLGLQHVLAQTAVRSAGAGHAQANAALLPESIAALRRRLPAPLDSLDAQLPISLEQLSRLLRETTGGDGLTALARDEALLDRVVAAAVARTAELTRTPPPPDADELRRIYRAAAAA